MQTIIKNSEDVVRMLHILVEDCGMSQVAISSRIGISRVSIRNAMIGKTTPSTMFINRMNKLVNELQSEITIPQNE